MNSNLNLEDRTTSITSSFTNTATCDPYSPAVTLSMMPTRENIQVNGKLPPTRENIQVNGKLPLHSTVDKLPLHSTVGPQTAGPARETASKVSEFEPPTIPLASFVSLLLYTQPLPYATLSPEGLLLPELDALQYKEATPYATLSPKGLLLPKLEALQYREATPCATLSPEGLLPPELEALQYKEATPLKKSVSQSTDQVLLATGNSAVVAQAPLPLLSPPT
jgi:hypothetical protein